MGQEYVVYRSHMVHSKKKELPKVINVYLCDSLYDPSYSKDMNRAYRFYDPGEALHTADLLNMEVGVLEVKVTPFQKKLGGV